MKKVIAIFGSTGVGKSKLALQLSEKIPSEIINVDALQVYQGLDILTNKPSTQERLQTRHHLLDFLPPTEEYYVGDFIRQAEKLIDEIIGRGRTPILVGGSHYYLQSLLFENSLLSFHSDNEKENDQLKASDRQRIEKALNENNLEQMNQLLKELDPLMSIRWHPNDDRKIRNSLQLLLDTGKKHSELLLSQKSSFLKFDSLLFWVYSKQETLNPRLDARVDEMLNLGLLNEIKELMSKIDDQSQIDITKGIYQSIGFRQWLPYLKEPTEEKFKESVELMKLNTRQYAKRQISWIKKKLLPALLTQNENMHLHVLDASLIREWDQQVFLPALNKTNVFLNYSLNKKSIDVPKDYEYLLPQKEKESKTSVHWERHVCDICEKECHGELEWKIHLKSKKHKNNVQFRNSKEYPFYMKAKILREQQKKSSNDD